MHIRVVTPVVSTGLTLAEHFEGILPSSDLVTFVELEQGPISIETEFDKVFAGPDTVARVVQAEREGVDAIVIDCMCDPALRAAREAVSIPVVGPCEAMMSLACMLGHGYSILSVAENMRVIFESQARTYGFWEKYKSTRTIDVPVTDLAQSDDVVRKVILERSIEAIEKDGSDVLILGCTGIIGVAQSLQDELAQAGIRIPVLDPIPTSIRLAKLIVESGLTHSKIAYPSFANKEVRGYALNQEHSATFRFPTA